MFSTPGRNLDKQGNSESGGMALDAKVGEKEGGVIPN